jgi:hypothetical protein
MACAAGQKLNACGCGSGSRRKHCMACDAGQKLNACECGSGSRRADCMACDAGQKLNACECGSGSRRKHCMACDAGQKLNACECGSGYRRKGCMVCDAGQERNGCACEGLPKPIGQRSHKSWCQQTAACAERTMPLRVSKRMADSFHKSLSDPSYKSRTVLEYTGCASFGAIMSALALLFRTDMSQANYGVTTPGVKRWSLDHIIPQHEYDPTDDAELRRCWSLANLAPEWSRDNSSKGARLMLLPGRKLPAKEWWPKKWDGEMPAAYLKYSQ